jgi:hypothetical protein
MANQEITSELWRLAQEIGTSVTRMHPVTGQLTESPERNEILKALFELTKQVEVVKKQLLKLQTCDDSNVL